MEVPVKLPVIVYVDNKGAIFITDNPVVKRTKHIDTRYHVIREHIENGIIMIIYVTSEENMADTFTKNTGEATHVNHRQKLTVSTVEECMDLD